MKTFIRACVVLCSLAALAGCDFLKRKSADADAAASADAPVADTPAADAGAAPATTPVAVNEGDVARFPDETKLADVQATVKRFAFVRESPSTGKVVIQVNNGQSVTEIAQRQNFFLVTVDSGGQKKMGWLTADAFTPIVDSGLHAPTCTAPEVALEGDAPFCGRTCGSDQDCPAGLACKGTAQRFGKGNVLLPGTVAVCTVVKGGTVTPVVTAPPVATGLSQSPDISAPPCQPGFVLVARDRQCHRLCAAGPGVKVCRLFCIKCDGTQICSDTRDFCK